MVASRDEVGAARVAYEVDIDAFTGSARVTVPVPTTAARALTPRLVLQGGGGGNSIVGMGWSLGGMPAVTIDASEHLPRWDGRDGVALGGTPLVPWLDDTGAPRRRDDGAYVVTTLRPRVGFARVRVEAWRHRATGEVHYRARDERDVLTIYGARPGGAARIADPDDATRVAAWLPELSIDPDGNALWFEYAAEDARGLDRGAPWEPRRPVTTQRYPTRIRYGNVAPIALDDAAVAGTRPDVRFALALVVDYGDHGDADAPSFDPDRAWPARRDAFATARDGFVVRTVRRVRRFVCFHDVAALGPAPVAVTALELGYDDDPAGARLRTVHQVGYVDGAARRTAALTLSYAQPAIADEAATTPTAIELTSGRRQLVDLYGEGLPGVLYHGEGGWLYQGNRGGGRFAEPALVGAQPSLGRGATLTDWDRDGDTELAITSGRHAGAFALDREDARWRGFRPFAAWPHVEGLAGRTFWIDLNGDGRTDVVIARGDALVWFPSRTGPLDESEAEFTDPIVVPLPTGAERAPGAGADPRLDLSFVDMTGDGLPDLVRVRRGAVEYWPSLGNGRFGERVVMDGAPTPSTLEGFDSARVRWADVAGNGTSDLLYLDDGALWHYPNRGGRDFGPGRRIDGLARFDARHAAIADVTGDGRPSLVWSPPDAGRARGLSYLPLAPATVPGSLVAIDDGCGRRTELVWNNSATHYLRDAADGAPWETRLPSHRPVIDARVERDLVGGTAVTTRYRYRDGFYDGASGAFRGFGRVETLDVPTVGAADTAPLRTRTWFHLGTPMWNHHRPFEPYTGDALAPRLAPHVEGFAALPSADTAAALRLLAGSVVRRERWSMDAAHPFDVECVGYQLALVQPRRGAQRPVFGVVPRERWLAQYEGVAGDPRVTHELVVRHDAWGTPTRTAEIAYARRGAVEDPAQARTWVTITDATRADVDDATQFAIGAAVESARFELVGTGAATMTIAALTAPTVEAALAAPVPFEVALDPAATAPAARRLAWQRTYYWNDTRSDAAPLGAIGRAPRVHHTAEAALTPGLVAAALGTRADASTMAALGYALADGCWWQASPTQDVTAPFGLVSGTTRSDGAITRVRYDADALAVIETIDPLGLTTTLAIDYRTLAPARTIDPNGTIVHAAFDALGRPTATAIEGHIGAAPWGSGPLAAWRAPAIATTASVLADPAGYLGAAATATFIDDRAWERDGAPCAVVTIGRTALVHDGAGDGDASGPLEIAVRYLDGFGRVLQAKTRVEAGLAIQRDATGEVVVDATGPVLAFAAERWQVSGHVVYDAKGQPARVFEPYFSPRAGYERDAVLEQFGVSTLTTYDALGRAVRVDLPNGSYARTRIAAWATEAASPGDTVESSLYRALREGRSADDAERAAYEHARAHADTPTVTHVDPRGLICATVAIGDASGAARRVRTVHDASGHEVATIDPRGLIALTYARDLRGRVLAQTSVDAGPAWALPDAFDRPARAWDARGFAVERSFDAADRPVAVVVRGGDGPAPLDAQVETYIYGDAAADRAAARAANTLGRVVETRDGAGVMRMMAYEPPGAPRAVERQLCVAVDTTPDWRGAVALEPEVLTTAARTDALGRLAWTRLVDGTVRANAYHPGGALASVRVTTPDGALVDVPIVDAMTRDAHGRIASATLGNGVTQTWRYDRETGRLAAHDAARGARVYQGLRFTHDPDGKIVRALDLAQDGANAVLPSAVSARRDFRYDVHGRMIEATGRVHRALLPHDHVPGTGGTVNGARRVSLDDGGALERYTQRFTYDPSGNLLRLQHTGTSASWATALWVATDSNRATAALDPNGVPVVDPGADFDAAGNLVRLAHLRAMAWAWNGCLGSAVTVARPAGPVDDDERYAYGADRVRVRKVATRLVVGGAAPVVETREVVYLGGQERVRVRRGDTLVLERWTTHVDDGERRVAVVDRHVVDTLANEVDAIGPARVRYHLTTPQGSTAIELDEAGRLISYEEYLPHGGSAFVAGDDARQVARRDVRYAGKERDRATGLHCYPQRYYVPWLGRWLSCDPIGVQGGLNLYEFVGGDLVGSVDPEGTDDASADDTTRRDGYLWAQTQDGQYRLYQRSQSGWQPFDDQATETIEVVDTRTTHAQPGGSAPGSYSDEDILSQVTSDASPETIRLAGIHEEFDAHYRRLATRLDKLEDLDVDQPVLDQIGTIYRELLVEMEAAAIEGRSELDLSNARAVASHYKWGEAESYWLYNYERFSQFRSGIFYNISIRGAGIDSLYMVVTGFWDRLPSEGPNTAPTRYIDGGGEIGTAAELKQLALQRYVEINLTALEGGLWGAVWAGAGYPELGIALDGFAIGIAGATRGGPSSDTLGSSAAGGKQPTPDMAPTEGPISPTRAKQSDRPPTSIRIDTRGLPKSFLVDRPARYDNSANGSYASEGTTSRTETALATPVAGGGAALPQNLLGQGAAPTHDKSVAIHGDEVVQGSPTLDWDSVVPKSGKYKGQNRRDHVRLHNIDNPKKPEHGVFYADAVDTIEEAWARAHAQGIIPDAEGVLRVPMGRVVGVAGGQTGVAVFLPLTDVVIILRPGTNMIITGYPSL